MRRLALFDEITEANFSLQNYFPRLIGFFLSKAQETGRKEWFAGTEAEALHRRARAVRAGHNAGHRGEAKLPTIRARLLICLAKCILPGADLNVRRLPG